MLEVKVVNSLIRKNLIAKEEAEIYKYGLEVFFLKVTHIICILLVGFAFRKFIEVVVFLVLFSLLRSTLYGYHSKTKLTCFMISLLISVILIIVICLPNNFYERRIFEIIFFIFLITYFILIVKSVNRKKYSFSLVVILSMYLISKFSTFYYLKMIVVYALGITLLFYLIKKLKRNEE